MLIIVNKANGIKKISENEHYKARKKLFLWVGHILMYEKSDLKQSKWSVNQLSNHVGGNSSQNSHYSLHEHTLCVQMNITFTTLISNVDLHLSLLYLIYWHLLYVVVVCMSFLNYRFVLVRCVSEYISKIMEDIDTKNNQFREHILLRLECKYDLEMKVFVCSFG